MLLGLRRVRSSSGAYKLYATRMLFHNCFHHALSGGRNSRIALVVIQYDNAF